MSSRLFEFESGYDWAGISSETFNVFDQWHEQGRLGFLELPSDNHLHSITKQMAKKYLKNCDTLFVAGIGGSSLGLRAILSALRDEKTGRVVVIDSPDSRVIEEALAGAVPSRSGICVITKSGGTAETLAIFMQLRQLLGAGVPVVAITDPVTGELRKLAEAKQWDTLPIPSNVGGRFSVLSPVGLFPASFAGKDTDRLLAGAEAVADDFRARRENSLAAQIAGAFLANFKSHPIHVFMPYSDFLFDTALWFAQLWAESLGKAKDLKGNTVHTGQTPLASRGPADQHSLVQLFMEGPSDKTVTILTEEKPVSNTKSDGEFGDVPTMSYLEGRSPDELRLAEADATATALAERGLPVSRIRIPEISPEYLGQIFMALETATVLSGLELDIDPLNQPGVERGKVLTYRAMGRQGY